MQNAVLFLLQGRCFDEHLHPIGIIQSCAAMAFVLVLIAMIAADLDQFTVSSMLYLSHSSLLMVSTLISTREIHITNTALDEHLSDRGSIRNGSNIWNQNAVRASRQIRELFGNAVPGENHVN